MSIVGERVSMEGMLRLIDDDEIDLQLIQCAVRDGSENGSENGKRKRGEEAKMKW